MSLHSAYLNLNRILGNTFAEGPGLRFCLWTQGCLHRCPDCCNADMLPIEPRMLVTVGEVCKMIKHAYKETGIEGVTFLGGEPMLQAVNLTHVAKFAHAHDLSVLVFSGYTIEECRANVLPGMTDLLTETDVFIDGPYRENMSDKLRNWVGSSNQRFHYLTSAYDSSIETDPSYRGVIEVRSEGRCVMLNGCPKATRNFLARGCGEVTGNGDLQE